MTLVPLPDVPCLRARMIWSYGGGTELGCRLFLKYTGGPPSPSDCDSIAADIEAAYVAHLAALVSQYIDLVEVDVLDIASYAGSSGAWDGSTAGLRDGPTLPKQIAFNLQYLISRRYRGGKPKGYWPFGINSDQADPATFSSGLVSAVGTAFPAFVTALASIVEGTTAIGGHVNLSYKHLFTNVANSSGREHAVPTYRATALHDDITGYRGHAEMSSQRRRRTAITP